MEIFKTNTRPVDELFVAAKRPRIDDRHVYLDNQSLNQAGIVKPVSAPTPPNPKKLYGDKKPALAQLPLVGMVAQATAHMDGDYKYGFRNWRGSPIEAVTYLNAIIRHAMLWAEGEEFARDTGVNNLGAVMACCAILLDAQSYGSLIDNRSHSAGAADTLHDAEEIVCSLNKAKLAREASK